MTTRLENIWRMRDLLDRPNPSSPTFHDYMRQELSEEQRMVNDLNNTGQPWATEVYQLNYHYGQNVYTINVSNWGKVLYVCRFTGNQYIPWVTVPFSDVDDQKYGTIWANWTNVYGSFWQPSETPEMMAFSRKGVLNSEIRVEINPMPMQNWSYQITYIPGYIGPSDPLESSIQMPEHAELVQLRGAASLTPYAEWGTEEVMNDAKRKRLATGFEYQLGSREQIFATYKHSINIPKPTWCDSWNG